MFEAVGHSVSALVRTRFGPFRLGGLKAGGVRPAREDELAEARALVGAGPSPTGTAEPLSLRGPIAQVVRAADS